MKKHKPYKRESLGNVYNHRLEDKTSNKWIFISGLAMMAIAGIGEMVVIVYNWLTHK